jgi:hypothetical protein
MILFDLACIYDKQHMRLTNEDHHPNNKMEILLQRYMVEGYKKGVWAH